MIRLTRKTVLGLILATLIFSPAQASATMPATDASTLGKLVARLFKLQQRINLLTEKSTRLRERIAALGKVGPSTLPMLDEARIGDRLRQDIQCLASRPVEQNLEGEQE